MVEDIVVLGEQLVAKAREEAVVEQLVEEPRRAPHPLGMPINDIGVMLRGRELV